MNGETFHVEPADKLRVSVGDRPCVMHPEDDCSTTLPCCECPAR